MRAFAPAPASLPASACLCHVEIGTALELLDLSLSGEVAAVDA